MSFDRKSKKDAFVFKGRYGHGIFIAEEKLYVYGVRYFNIKFLFILGF